MFEVFKCLESSTDSQIGKCLPEKIQTGSGKKQKLRDRLHCEVSGNREQS